MAKQTQWTELVAAARAEEAPTVDLRWAIRERLSSEIEEELSLADAILALVGGSRGRILCVVASMVFAVLLGTAFLTGMGQENGSEWDDDPVTQFIESGDWSEWL